MKTSWRGARIFTRRQNY